MEDWEDPEGPSASRRPRRVIEKFRSGGRGGGTPPATASVVEMDEEVKTLCRTISSLGPFDSWAAMAHDVGHAGEALGWWVKTDAEVPYLVGDTKRMGRIPLVMRDREDRATTVVAIELGRREPRLRSLAKLNAFQPATDRLVVLRESIAKPHWMGKVVVFATVPNPAILKALAKAQASRRTG